MGKEKRAVHFLCVFLVFFLMMGIGWVDGAGGRKRHHHHTKQQQQQKWGGGGLSRAQRSLFVFGDSYADTGNLPKIFSPSWSEPYGVTFPGKPSGRFSDGRVFTDFLASFLGIRSPIPYRYRRVGRKLIRYGMNFAVGGTGVFDTALFQNNLTVQIDTFEGQLREGVFSELDLGRSLAVVSVAGNDYVYYGDNGGSMEGIKAFTPKLIGQLKSDLKRLLELGVGKVAVTNLPPLGCVPYLTRASSYQTCNDTVNAAVAYHNQLLDEAVEELNINGGDSKPSTAVVTTIDYFGAFTSMLNQGMKKKNALKPCCDALSSEYRCGGVDLNGTKQYTLCEDPRSTIYWDSVHPSQAGWETVFSVLNPSHNSLLNY